MLPSGHMKLSISQLFNDHPTSSCFIFEHDDKIIMIILPNRINFNIKIVVIKNLNKFSLIVINYQCAFKKSGNKDIEFRLASAIV